MLVLKQLNTTINMDINMNESIISILDYVNENKTELNIDQKVNYVYNKYDIGLSLMNEAREYFKQNTLQN